MTTSHDYGTAVIVCGPPPNTCWYCGEYLHIEEQGGYIGPHDNRYCTQECIEELIERQATDARGSDWCPSCGYDRHEHAPDCANNNDGDGA